VNEHIRNQLKKEMKERDGMHLEEVVKYIKFLLTNKGLQTYHERMEKKKRDLLARKNQKQQMFKEKVIDNNDNVR